MSDYEQRALVERAVQKCEAYAEEIMGEDVSTFTQTTMWDDGDFQVMVWHGKGHEEQPWRQDAEKVEYNHFEEEFVYADITRMVHRHTIQTNEAIVLEERRVS